MAKLLETMTSEIIDTLNTQWNASKLELRRKTLAKQAKDEQVESRTINREYFDLRKNLTLLAGTIFSSSLALSAGKLINDRFLFGELFLLIATLVGLTKLLSETKIRERMYFWKIKFNLETDLSLNKDIIDNFERVATNDLIRTYDKLINELDSSFLYKVFRVVPINLLDSLFYTSLIIGLFSLWASVI